MPIEMSDDACAGRLPRICLYFMATPLCIRHVLFTLVVLTLAGCAGGNGGGKSSASISGPAVTGGPDWASRGVTFNTVLAQQILASAEFRNADANCVYFGCGSAGAPGNQSQAYELHNLHEALSSGLTGAGSLVAIVDSGFRPTHQEFAGKTIYQYGGLPSSDHGNHVASLIAGIKDGRGMFGVAPAASLHLTAINPTGAATLDIANVTAGTLDAAARGAVAQNNSWGFDVAATTLQAHLASHPGETVAQGLNAVIANYGSPNWQAYLDALDSFENGGVVVWALSNTTTMTSGDVMATLPYFDSRLKGAWIAAANGYFEVDGTGNINRAIRLSAACGLAAQFCIAGDGTTTAANAVSDSGYSSGTGTSYVAPQISGAVALLAQAFPDLTAQEWAKRLLASADNSWFTTQGVVTSGTVDFGNGVTHGYSDEWGHGVLDIAAALRPIGTVAVLSGDAVTTSPRTSLADSTLVTPAAFGDSLKTALAGTDIAVFDGLNRSFAVQGSALVTPAQPTMLPNLLAAVSGPRWGSAPSYEAVLSARPAAQTNIALVSNMGGLLDRSAIGTTQGSASIFSTIGDGIVLTTTRRQGPFEISAAGFAGYGGATDQDTAAGAGVKLALGSPPSSISVGVSYLSEQGNLLGLGHNPSFDFGDGSAIGTLHLGVDQQIFDGVQLFGRLEYGSAHPTGGAGGLVASIGDIAFSGFEIGASLASVLAKDDRLSFSLSQPLRIEAGALSLSLPSGRTADGQIVQRQADADLSPGGRQLDLGVSYKTPVGTGQLQLGLQYSLDAGHVRGASALGIALGFGQSF